MDLYQQALEHLEYSRNLRRDFHSHPELGFQEFRTAGVVARELNALGLEVNSGVGKTGVVALLEGAKPGPVIMIRCDMDALPILEQTGAEYASQNPGVMHACGHDAHTAIGLTVARLLTARRETLSGSVKFIFQPAEEGLGGAEAMIADGALENPHPEMALGLHVWNDRPLGWAGIVPGAFMAAAEIFRLRIKGKGGHGAVPHLAVDPVLASAQIITALQSIASRNVSPLETAVVSVTAIRGGETFNVIPPEVEMQGTIRTFSPAVRELVLERFRTIIYQVASAMGCQAELDLQFLTSAVVNDEKITARVQKTVAQLMPDLQIDTHYATMGSEDMSSFMNQIPGCFFFVGSANAERGLNAAHHHPKFDIDEEVLPRAAAMMAAAALELLQG